MLGGGPAEEEGPRLPTVLWLIHMWRPNYNQEAGITRRALKVQPKGTRGSTPAAGTNRAAPPSSRTRSRYPTPQRWRRTFLLPREGPLTGLQRRAAATPRLHGCWFQFPSTTVFPPPELRSISTLPPGRTFGQRGHGVPQISSAFWWSFYPFSSPENPTGMSESHWFSCSLYWAQWED